MSRRASDRGAAAVEMALVLPVLLLIVFAIIDFGRLLNAQISVTEAAREGARAATIGPSNAGTADARAKLVNSEFGVDGGASIFCDSADDVTVVVSYDFNFITPVGAIASMFSSGSEYSDLVVYGTGVMPCRA